MKDREQILSSKDLSIPLPCPVSWELMEEQADGNRFCDECQKTVFDLAGKTRVDLDAIYEAHGPSICGNLYADQMEDQYLANDKQKKGLPNIFKTVAAAAVAIAMLHSPLNAKEGGKEKPNTEITESGPRTFPDPELNTLVTGVILTQNDQNVAHDLVVKVFLNGDCIETIHTRHGFFSLDLNERCTPADTLTLLVPSQNFKSGHYEHEYAKATVHVALRDGQNVPLKVKYTPPPRKRTGGVMVRPIR